VEVQVLLPAPKTKRAPIGARFVFRVGLMQRTSTRLLLPAKANSNAAPADARISHVLRGVFGAFQVRHTIFLPPPILFFCPKIYQF
jgi:hypothetical protein